MIARRSIMAVFIAALVAACGATPPQAPLDQAKKLDEATSGISTACGEAAQLTAFGGADPRDLDTLEATATADAQKLAGVYKRNPEWVYQSDKISALVHDSVTMLHDCGLSKAEATLRRLTSGR